MLMMPMAMAKRANMAIWAIMATIVKANGNFIMVIRSIQLKSKKTSSLTLDSYGSDFLLDFIRTYIFPFSHQF